jgi:VanZ family protein
VDVFLNLLLFAPLGAGLRLAGWRWRSVVAAAALVSFTVELLQFTVVTGRDASLSDLVTNTTGAAVAAALAARWRAIVLPAPRAAARLFALL